MEILTNPWVVGIVAAVVGGLILYFVFGIGKAKPKRKLDKQVIIQENAQPAPPPVPVESAKSDITPKEIHEYLDSLPPLQRETAAQNYKGIKVSWRVSLSGGYPQESGKLRLQMRTTPKGHLGYLVCCEIERNHYPQLKVIKEDQVFVIEGEIESVNDLSIDLKNCRLLF